MELLSLLVLEQLELAGPMPELSAHNALSPGDCFSNWLRSFFVVMEKLFLRTAFDTIKSCFFNNGGGRLGDGARDCEMRVMAWTKRSGSDKLQLWFRV